MARTMETKMQHTIAEDAKQRLAEAKGGQVRRVTHEGAEIDVVVSKNGKWWTCWSLDPSLGIACQELTEQQLLASVESLLDDIKQMA